MPHPNGEYAVRHPEAEGVLVVLNPAVDYATDDPLVGAYPWAFKPLDTTIRESMPVEQATAAPGEKRRGPGRPRKTPQ